MVFMPAFQARLLTEIYVRLYSTYYHSTVVRFSGQRKAISTLDCRDPPNFPKVAQSQAGFSQAAD
jgi:hypothetical protein